MALVVEEAEASEVVVFVVGEAEASEVAGSDVACGERCGRSLEGGAIIEGKSSW